jgi:sugar-specific transcriptional regulator TrmB
MPIDTLQSIGLTKNEAETYELLLSMGEAPMSDLLHASRKHPPIIYRAIEGLVSKGLVTSQTRKRRKYVAAKEPSVLFRMEREKLKAVEEAVAVLEKMQRKTALSVELSRGKEAVHDLRMRAFSQMKAGSTYYIIGASGDQFYKIMGDKNKAVEKIRIDRKIHKKMLSFESQRQLLDRNETYRTYSEHRFLPVMFPIPSSTNIFDDTVATLIWSDDPVVITIKSKAVAESYLHYFDALWATARA